MLDKYQPPINETEAWTSSRYELQRLRRTPGIRAMLRESHVRTDQLVMPYFVAESVTRPHRWPVFNNYSVDDLVRQVRSVVDLGIKSVLLFGVPQEKSDGCESATCPGNFFALAIETLRREIPELVIITDVCLCSYTQHGHCGVIGSNGNLDHVATLKSLAAIALTHTAAGADWVAPSAMADGMVAAIRERLDSSGHNHTGIISYSTKFASAMYGPFRDAAKSTPQFGDRRGYQLDPANRRQAIEESLVDVDEGADAVMVKPAGNYLDIIRDLRNEIPHKPIAAYQVSGEYALIKHAVDGGLIDEWSAIEESLIAIKRAGADLIITYFARQWAEQNLEL